MFPFLILPIALALGLATRGAPSPAQRAAADSAAVANENKPVTVAFTNDATDLATVYVVPDHGMAVRLGQVSAGQTARLVIPRGVVAGATSVNIVAVPFARRFYTGSGPVTVMPGDALSARLDPSENGVWVLPQR